MRTTLNLILLSALCAGATKIFDFDDAKPIGCQTEPAVDFSGLKIEHFSYASYLAGDIVVRKKLTNSIQVHYVLNEVYNNLIDDKLQVEDSQSGEATICDFINGFVYKNLLPMFDKHNDFPVQPPNAKSNCEIAPGTYHIFKVDDVDKLQAESEMSTAWHTLNITLYDGDTCLGGFYGFFGCSSD